MGGKITPGTEPRSKTKGAASHGAPFLIVEKTLDRVFLLDIIKIPTAEEEDIQACKTDRFVPPPKKSEASPISGFP